MSYQILNRRLYLKRFVELKLFFLELKIGWDGTGRIFHLTSMFKPRLIIIQVNRC